MSKQSRETIELVPFHGDQIEAIRNRNGTHYVAPRRISENLGLDWAGQYTKLKSSRWARVEIIPMHDAAGRKQDMVVIPLRSVPMWLAGINTEKVDPVIRDRIELYQDEAAEVLARHFLGNPEKESLLLQRISELESENAALKNNPATVPINLLTINTLRLANDGMRRRMDSPEYCRAKLLEGLWDYPNGLTQADIRLRVFKDKVLSEDIAKLLRQLDSERLVACELGHDGVTPIWRLAG